MTKDLWNIEKEFERMRRQMDHLMNGFFSDSFERDAPLLGSSNKNKLLDTSFKTPATDIYETDKEVVAKIDVPGVKKEDIKLEVKNGMLSLKAEHKLEKEDKNEKKDFIELKGLIEVLLEVFHYLLKLMKLKLKLNIKMES